MANTDKNILITPNIGSTTDDPKIVFSGADATTGAQNITMKVYPTNNGTLSVEGSAGQLFSVTNDMTGTIFSVNDVSGIPSIEVDADGTVKIAEFSGNVYVGAHSYIQPDTYGWNINSPYSYFGINDGADAIYFLGLGYTGLPRIEPGTDNRYDLGSSTYRFKTLYASTGSINTSDKNLKQDISELSEAETRVAVAIKGLIKKFRFIDAVSEKGDDARIHVGVIAQEVASAFEAEGLDPNRYAMFCSDTWYEVDGVTSPDMKNPYTQETPNAVPVSRLGIRYDELFAFVISAI